MSSRNISRVLEAAAMHLGLPRTSSVHVLQTWHAAHTSIRPPDTPRSPSGGASVPGELTLLDSVNSHHLRAFAHAVPSAWSPAPLLPGECIPAFNFRRGACPWGLFQPPDQTHLLGTGFWALSLSPTHL